MVPPTHPPARPGGGPTNHHCPCSLPAARGIARRSPESPLPVHSPTVCFTSPVMSAAAAAAAAARCVPLRVSSPETAKSAASIPTSSAASASAPLRAAVAAGPGRRLPAPPFRCSSSSPENSAPRDLGLLLEVEGVLADVYRFGNRQAFNVAFRSLGLDCANWTEPIYADLVRKACGDEERMLALFFDRVSSLSPHSTIFCQGRISKFGYMTLQIGWPTSLPTSEKGSFIKSVLREKLKALEEFSASDSLPLRPGVEKFIDDALGEGVPLAILAAYGRNGEKISRSIAMKLGPERISKIKIVGNVEVEESFYGQLVLGKGVTSGLDEQLVREAQKAASAEKQRIAEKVASILKLSVDITASESSDKVIAALRAGSEYVGCDVQSCILVAGSQSGVLAAERIGMPCIVVRSSFTARAEFHSAKAVMDGFGDTDLTVSKLLSKKWF
ncbi:Haloacid dehalogenase-like hydrolase (HAD) superfamily protein [Zea mays]|uniref:Haloacid dehalogenase-like hydrolase (HAD) superfamily protein n=1 Tax=Zea mays TaxID=4577 RepID=A0A1D6KGR4_MAIZE|nr:Haloacid dehalogenase-like hydrolase (HAD) superfamily protein [Zea mays]ONM02268.1 Haloacid dehalogenase-like hydrolase (HAD) superfamily protein [Zea mays]